MFKIKETKKEVMLRLLCAHIYLSAWPYGMRTKNGVILKSIYNEIYGDKREVHSSLGDSTVTIL